MVVFRWTNLGRYSETGGTVMLVAGSFEGLGFYQGCFIKDLREQCRIYILQAEPLQE